PGRWLDGDARHPAPVLLNALRRRTSSRFLGSAEPLESILWERERAGVTGASGRPALRVGRCPAMKAPRAVLERDARVRSGVIGEELQEPRLRLTACDVADSAPLILQP